MSHAAAAVVSTRARTAWLTPLLVLVTAAAVSWWAAGPYVVGVFHDDGVYALLAKSLAAGKGFHYLQLPGAPAATHYPPLYPLLLAAVWRLDPRFPENLPGLLGLNAICIGVAALGCYRLVKRWFGWSSAPAAAVSLFAMLGTPVLTLSSALLSEPLFLAGLAPTLLVAHEALGRDDDRSSVIAGMAIGALMLVRAHAVALLGATLVLFALRRAWRPAVILFVAALVVQLPWLLWCASAAPLVATPLSGAYGAYSDFFRDGWRAEGLALVLGTMRVNLRELWLLLGDRVWSGLGSIAGLTSAMLLLVLLVAGARRAARRTPVLPLFLVLYFAIILVWSYAPYRYAWGVWPLLVVLAALGAEEIVSRMRRPAWRVVAVIAVALPLAALLRTEARSYATRAWEQPGRDAARNIAPLVEWIRRNTPPGAGVLVEAPEIVMLFTGRQGAPPVPFTAREYVMPVTARDHEQGLRAMLAAVPARYIVTLNPAVRAAALEMPNVSQIGTLPNATMFEVRR